ncbi:hypothetical protein Ndes2437A_g04228 [Nannochloris sp. 'desiccata']
MSKTLTDPGLYELGISMPQAKFTVVPIYLGQSSNVRSRHLAYTRDGDHLKDIMVSMVNNGHTLWQRVRYLETGLQAQRWEARFLVDYDYAWNGQLNPKKRYVKLEHRDCCCCTLGVDVISPQGSGTVTSPLTISLLATPLKNCSSWTWYLSLTLQILFSITIICIVALQLSVKPTGDAGVPGATQLTSECLLGVDSQGNSLCVYSYAAAGISIVCSFALVLLAETAFRRGKGWHGMLEAIIAGAVSIWWAIAAIVFTRYSTQADLAGVPKASWRDSIYSMSWVEAGLWGMCFLVKSMLSLLRCCASKSRAHNAPSPYANGAGSVYPENYYQGGNRDRYGAVPPTLPPMESDNDGSSLPPSPTAPTWPHYAPQQQFISAAV